MKHFKYTKIFGWFAATALLLTTSCKDDLFETNNGLSDEVTVTFTLAPEAATSIATRTVNYPKEGQFAHISDGSKADMLIYAVYDKDGKLLEGYCDGSDVEGFDHGKGQTIRSIEKFPVTIALTLKRGEQYSVAFWAQSSKTKAYNTADLKKVEVIYGELNTGVSDNDEDQHQSEDGKEAASVTTSTPNNDEFRDAFCRSVTFTAGENGGLEQDVWLYRPLAQINVGTSGFDFESITRGVPKAGKRYLYSKIRLNRVARYLDVVEDKTYSSTTNDNHYSTNESDKTSEAFAVADFGYALIPAYANYPYSYTEDETTYDTKRMPADPSYTIWDWEYNPNGFEPEKIYKEAKADYVGEEFLKIHLYDKKADDENESDDHAKLQDGYYGYANLNNYSEKKSEIFKYLSMCYVLTSSTIDERILINNVKVWMATDENGADSIEVVNINNVPAQRNWRTNIVGNLFTEEVNLNVTLDQNFAGEYNGLYGNEDMWSGPLAKGVYYDAKNDEIQISDVDGLLWFQEMVNGDLTIRKTKKGNEGLKGTKYPYVDEYGVPQTLDYISHKSSDYDETLRNRILKATHQDQNVKPGWPKNNNFHFCGKNGPAKVKLMADIDLSGKEWIPIGFDFRIYDTSVSDPAGGVGTGRTINLDFKEDNDSLRAFCGIFDGNNHTISNLKNKRFDAEVATSVSQDDSFGPYDNVQWFPAGFFGMVGGCGVNSGYNGTEHTRISNLRLFNVDIYGYHTAAGVAAIVNSVDDKIDITDCLVDGGSITLSPMYRGDTHREKTYQTRTFARGIYLGGIVGQYVADGVITGCEVRNVSLRGYRQIGGLVGSVSNKEQEKIVNYTANKFKNLKIEGNTITNLLLLADKFQPYDSIYNIVDNNAWKNGFGWKKEQRSLANPFVGGTLEEVYKDNINGGIQFTELSTGIAAESDTLRTATIGSVPLQYIPMLSSWFCDKVNLEGNYYGMTAVRTRRNYHKFEAYTWKPGNITFDVPFDLPENLSVDYDLNSPKAAMYVESVTLDGQGAIGGRALITPEGVSGNGACVMYVTSRDRKQFFESPTNKATAAEKAKVTYKKSTIIKNVALRGMPWAWAGMLFAPNENMSGVELENVTIYDVYKTLALDEGDTKWPSGNSITLTAKNSNFRGYTVPGKGWSLITYENTTFEQGTYTGIAKGDEEMTYKVEANTDFHGCYFKAPYVIDLTAVNGENGPKVNFVETYATANSMKTVEIVYSKYPEATKIKITSDAQSHPIVTYYDKDGNVLPIE